MTLFLLSTIDKEEDQGVDGKGKQILAQHRKSFTIIKGASDLW